VYIPRVVSSLRVHTQGGVPPPCTYPGSMPHCWSLPGWYASLLVFTRMGYLSPVYIPGWDTSHRCTYPGGVYAVSVPYPGGVYAVSVPYPGGYLSRCVIPGWVSLPVCYSRVWENEARSISRLWENEARSISRLWENMPPFLPGVDNKCDTFLPVLTTNGTPSGRV